MIRQALGTKWKENFWGVDFLERLGAGCPSCPSQPNVETKTAHYILETPELDHALLLYFWLAERNVHGPKMGKLGGCRVGCQAYVSKLMKNSTSTRCDDFEMSTTKNWCIYISRCDMYIYIYYVQF